jgi:thiol-disulfide isomerase/thioredoxin
MPRRIIAALALGLALAAGTASAAPAPRVRAATLDDLAKPLPLPYDAKANSPAMVATARKRAIESNKLLLIDLGGNWCPDCRVLAGVLELREIRAFVAHHYEFVAVDIGRLDRNLDIPAAYGVRKLEGVPALLVVDPRTGKLLNTGRIFALADARHMTPQALADWLAQWTP